MLYTLMHLWSFYKLDLVKVREVRLRTKLEHLIFLKEWFGFLQAHSMFRLFCKVTRLLFICLSRHIFCSYLSITCNFPVIEFIIHPSIRVSSTVGSLSPRSEECCAIMQYCWCKGLLSSVLICVPSPSVFHPFVLVWTYVG
jgi:hypothetical protein